MDTDTRQIHDFQAGDLFDRHYKLLKHAGSGGFADVWKAEDTLVKTIVALKIYTRLDSEGISELAKEYKEMRGVKHPNLLTGNHFDASGNIPYLEMDYCDGGSLYGKSGKMTIYELRHVLRDIVGGLAYLHHEGIVHQDIKPENILYDTGKDRYLLSDFGISSKSRSRLSKSVNLANMTLSMTEAYAPPEKFSGKFADIEPDTKGDIFSLGMTLYELAVGHLPFTPPMATGREMLYSQGRLQLDYSKIEDPVLRQIVKECTKYSKEDRPTAETIVKMIDGGIDSKRQQSVIIKQNKRAAEAKTDKHHTVRVQYNAVNPKPESNVHIEKKVAKPATSKHERILLYITIPLVVVFFLWGLLTRHKHNEPTNIDMDSVEAEVVSDDSIKRIDGNDIVFTLDGTEYHREDRTKI